MFKKAILIIHGFAGGTYDQENLANYLQLNRGFDVFQFTLPGHVRNINKVKHEDWLNYSEIQLNKLINNGYKNIYLIGHSMGGVIATYLAVKYKEVKKLVLAAPAFQYLSVVKDDLNIKESIKQTPKVIKEYGTDEVVSRLLKMNPVAVKQFMELINKCYKYAENVKCPVLLIQGDNDSLVPISSSEYVYNSVKGKKTIVYAKGLNHDLFNSKKDNEIFKLVEQFLKIGVMGGVKNI